MDFLFLVAWKRLENRDFVCFFLLPMARLEAEKVGFLAAVVFFVLMFFQCTEEMLLLERSCDLGTKVNSAVLFLFSVFSYLSHLGVLVLDLSFVILFENLQKTSLLAAWTSLNQGLSALANPLKNEKLKRQTFIRSSGGGFNYQISFEFSLRSRGNDPFWLANIPFQIFTGCVSTNQPPSLFVRGILGKERSSASVHLPLRPKDADFHLLNFDELKLDHLKDDWTTNHRHYLGIQADGWWKMVLRYLFDVEYQSWRTSWKTDSFGKKMVSF